MAARKFRWSVDDGTTWHYEEGELPFNLSAVTSADTVIVEPIGAAVENAAPDAQRYLIAANRFAMPTDFGTGSAGFASGGGATGINGGTGSVLFRYFRRRFKFTTGPWAPLAGRFLWANATMAIGGVLDGLFSFTIQRAEIRSLADALVDTITWDGGGSHVMTPGEVVWSDAGADLEALTSYYLDIYYTAPDGASFPSVFANYLFGESAAANLSTDYSLGSMGLNGISSSIGGHFGPVTFVARGWDGESAAALLVGDSILDHTTVSAADATARGDIGFIQKALGNATGGVMTYMSAARYSSGTSSLTTDNFLGSGGTGFLNWFKAANDLLQDDPIFNAVIDEHGRNNMGTGLSQQKTWLADTLAAIRGNYPGMAYFKTTCPPYSTRIDGTAYSSESGQTPSTNEQAGNLRNQWNDWLIAGADGQIDGCFDTNAVCHGTDYAKWKVRSFETTLIDAVTVANSVTTVRLADAPAIGSTLVLEPADPSNWDIGGGYCVYTVTPNGGGGYDVALKKDSRSSNYAYGTGGYAGRVVKTHAAGSVVRTISSPDFLHPSNETQNEMSAVVLAGKAAIAAAVAGTS